MRRPAKILLAGIAAAILPLPIAVATDAAFAADSDFLNGQVQLGQVQTEQTLNVDTVSDQTTAVTSATGNGYTAAVQSGSIDVQSTQSVQGDINAHTVLNVTSNAGQQVSLTTAATGNTGEADTLGGQPLTATISQDAGLVLIRSDSQIEGENAQAGGASTSSQAIANSQGLGTTGGSVTAAVVQTSSATVEADGGAVLNYSPGTTTFSAVAVTNNVTATGSGGAVQNVSVSQSMTGEHTQATKFIAFGSGQAVTSAATATANNVSATNDGGALNVVTNQDNEGYLRAQAEATSFQFGTNAAVATGVGNSVIAQETGPQASLDNTQTNGGAGVDVLATSGGDNGYDISGSATAMGNAVTGSACSACGGRLTARNSQANTADVGASSTITVSSARSVTGVATAVGNNATFYVSTPAN